jgi:L-lactate dehydrogenase complex protein LldE
LVDFAEPEQCCGFGGTFSVSFPNISRNMGLLKIGNVLATEPDLLVSGDMSCLMHLRGLAEKAGRSLEVRHAIEILRDTMRSESLAYVVAKN